MQILSKGVQTTFLYKNPQLITTAAISTFHFARYPPARRGLRLTLSRRGPWEPTLLQRATGDVDRKKQRPTVLLLLSCFPLRTQNASTRLWAQLRRTPARLRGPRSLFALPLLPVSPFTACVLDGCDKRAWWFNHAFARLPRRQLTRARSQSVAMERSQVNWGGNHALGLLGINSKSTTLTGQVYGKMVMYGNNNNNNKY